jgi:hypothetical protein
MAQALSNSSQGTIVLVEQPPLESNVVTITLKKKKNKSVRWHEDVIDNEFLNKKKSKSTRPFVFSFNLFVETQTLHKFTNFFCKFFYKFFVSLFQYIHFEENYFPFFW